MNSPYLTEPKCNKSTDVKMSISSGFYVKNLEHHRTRDAQDKFLSGVRVNSILLGTFIPRPVGPARRQEPCTRRG